jgi:lipopolysaccharide transport system permease protein
LMRQGEMSDASELLTYARQHYAPHAGVWLISAEWARLQHDLELERDLLAQGCVSCPNQWELLCKSADLEMKLGNVDSAEDFNRMAREQASGRIEPLLQYAELAEKCEDWLQAELRWLQVIENKPELTRAYTQLSLAYKQLGKTAEARRYRLAAQYGLEMLAPVVQVAQQETQHKERHGLLHFMQLVNTKALLSLKSESSQTHLNYAWVVIEPLLHLSIYYFLFGQLLNAGVENYGLFLLCGLVPWMWFAKAIATSANSIIGGQALMLNSNIAPAFFPLVSIVHSTFKQLPALLLLLALGLATDVKTISWSLLWLPSILLVQLLLTTALALLLAAIVPFLRDLANLVGTGLTLLMFMSGVIYDYRKMPGRIGQWLEYNPLAVLIGSYREVIMEGRPPAFAGLAYVALVALLLLLVNYFIYRHHRHNFVRRGMC